MKRLFLLIKEIYEARSVIWTLAVNDFKNRYIGSYFGLSWAIVQSLVTFVLYWVVFEFFLGAKSPTNVPFALWLLAGLVPWMFFSDALNNSMSTFQSYAFVVKKMMFKISVLPLAKILSSFFMSIVLNAILLLLFAVIGRLSPIHLLDILYYNVCMFFLLVGLSFIISSVNVFFRDISQIVGIFIQIGTWFTPILWNYRTIGSIPEKYLWLFKLNPMFYITDGYRSALIDQVWFFGSRYQMLMFWVVSTAIFFLGAFVYVKLRPHFADVL